MKSSRIFGVTLVALFVLYGFAIYGLKPPAVKMYQSQWDENVAKAQLLLFGEPRDAVIVGSSLSARFMPEALGSCFYNVALAGGSVLSGLDLLAMTPWKPKLLLIESNEIQRTADPEFEGRVNSPLARAARFFRVDFKPVNFLLSAIFSARSTPQILHEKLMLRGPDPTQVALGLGVQQQSMANPLTGTALQDSLTKVRARVAELESAGIRVLFFEMPVDASLETLARSVQVREMVRQTFGDARMLEPWNKDDVMSVKTVDGIHLSYSNAYNLGRSLAAKVPCKNP
jgi:hypothetical protein